jgi:DNA sulfur modification protein DndE
MKQIRFSQDAKKHLSRLKGKTGIKNWNVLCRWALCYSLSEKTMPTNITVIADSNVEMSWHTFGGEYSDLYDAIMKAWCIEMGLPTDEGTIEKYFRLNMERGIMHLRGTGFIKNIDDLLELATKEDENEHIS